jgi:hypothetical protein
VSVESDLSPIAGLDATTYDFGDESSPTFRPPSSDDNRIPDRFDLTKKAILATLAAVDLRSIPAAPADDGAVKPHERFGASVVVQVDVVVKVSDFVDLCRVGVVFAKSINLLPVAR